MHRPCGSTKMTADSGRHTVTLAVTTTATNLYMVGAVPEHSVGRQIKKENTHAMHDVMHGAGVWEPHQEMLPFTVDFNLDKLKQKAWLAMQVRWTACTTRQAVLHVRLYHTSGCTARQAVPHVRLYCTSGCTARQAVPHGRLYHTSG